MGTGGIKINNKYVDKIIDEFNYGLSARQSEIGGIEYKIIKVKNNYEIIAFDKSWIVNISEKKLNNE